MIQTLIRLLRIPRWDRFTHKSARTYEFRRSCLAAFHRIARRLPWYRPKEYDLFEGSVQAECSRWVEGNVVLDVGCGPGDDTERFAVNCVGCVVIGADLSLGMAQAAKHRIPNGAALVADARFLPFASHSVDVVYANCLYHHVEPAERERVLLESRRVSRRVVLIKDIFGFTNPLVNWLYAIYYGIIDGSAYRFTLGEWREFLAPHVLSELHMPLNAFPYRYCFYVIRADTRESAG